VRSGNQYLTILTTGVRFAETGNHASCRANAHGQARDLAVPAESKIRSLNIDKNRYKHLKAEFTQAWMFVRTASKRPVVFAI
jgi:hypothetical protein